MKRTSTTNNYLLVLILLNIFLALIGLFVLFDFRNNRLVEIDNLNAQLRSLQGMSTRATNLRLAVKDSKEKRDKLSLYFITKKTVLTFVKELESIASRAGVILKLNSLSIVKEEKQQDKPSYLKLSVRASGGFSELFRFLTILEDLPYRVRFNTVGISKLESKAGFEKPVAPWFGDVDFDLISYVDK